MKLAIAAVGLVLLATGCAGNSGSSGSPSPSQTTPTPPAPSPTALALPDPQPWQANPADVTPAAKRVAAKAIETIGTWQTGQGGITAAQARLSTAGMPTALARQGSFLLGDAQAAVTNVIYTQYFGHAATTASVLAIAEQSLLNADGTISQAGTNFDVRVVKRGSQWQVQSITAAKQLPASQNLPAIATRVLNNANVELPAASRADVASGRVHSSVLRTLDQLAQDHKIFVSVFIAAHPINVYGTDRRSDHPPGYAVDIGAIDGKLVVDPANRALVTSVMRQAAALDPYQVGGPYDLDGGGTTYFSDDTHLDHLHLGFPD